MNNIEKDIEKTIKAIIKIEQRKQHEKKCELDTYFKNSVYRSKKFAGHI